jgi:2-polyprenyl-3-methyl-5-hydroxy-6-metoxy-1,4-benzoquinol methylase
MITYGVCIGPSDSYEWVCRPSLPSAAVVSERRQQSSIFQAYNSILEELTALSNLEAVVLVHDDVELGPRFEDGVRAALTTGAGVIGAIGSLYPPSIAWWKGETRGRAVETRRVFDSGGGTHDVETVDGFVMVLSPDCARRVRFDERTYPGFHGYDIDYCYEAKRAGFRVVVAPLDCVHHSKGSPYGIAYRQADLAWQRKWHRVPPYLLAVRRAKLALAQARRSRVGVGSEMARYVALVPESTKRLLDVGCFEGGFDRAMTARGVEVWGIDVDAAAASVASRGLSRAIVGDYPDALPQGERFDCITFNDALEHMADPARTLSATRSHLTEGGCVIASITNVRNVSVIAPLVLHGRWDYADAGVMDRTHLHWFTKATMRELFEKAGYRVERQDPIYLSRLEGRARVLNLLGRHKEQFIAEQYLLLARPVPNA